MARADRFVAFPSAFLEALLKEPLSGSQWRMLCWVVRRTWGSNGDSTLFSWYQIAKDLALDRGGVARAGHRLIQSGILSLRGDDLITMEVVV